MAAILISLVAPPCSPQASAVEIEHQYAPLREAKLEFKDFSFPTLDGATLNLREQASGQRLMLVTYFATWCYNSNYDVEVINELYAKYHEQGLAVVGVCEYSSAADLRAFIERHRPAYPICLEAIGEIKDRSATTHHRYRKQVGDQRKWGTPFSVVITAEEIKAQGATFAKRPYVAAGELIKAEFEHFIQQELADGRAHPPVSSE